MPTMVTTKKEMLHSIARDYVTKGLGEKNFDAIPYADAVELRAPICSGGSEKALVGKDNLKNNWWAPLPTLVGKTKVIDSFVNNDSTAVTVEFHCEILNPACTLRIIDKFTINDEGNITAQENFFDPRDLTHPGSK